MGMEEGNGVKQRGDEVGRDRNRAQTCGPVSREEERRGLTLVSSGCSREGQSRGWGVVGSELARVGGAGRRRGHQQVGS
jgi:hypothetical protein